MKKLACLVLSVTLLAGLAFPAYAAEQSSEAYRLYQNAMKKLEGKSLEMTGALNMSVSGVGDEYGIKANFTTKQLQSSKGELEAQMKIKAELIELGAVNERAAVEQHVKDGWVYTNVTEEDGESTKYRGRGVTPFTLSVPDIPKEFFKNATVEDIEGGKKLRLRLSGSDSRRYVKALGHELYDLFQAVTFQAVTITMTFGNDGALKTHQTNFKMSVREEDGEFEFKYAVILRIDSIGKLQKIDFPSDLASYSNY